MLDRGPWFNTISGRRFYPLAASVNDIDIGDIATSLANQCRFAGHVKTFYSVAQHSVLVSQVCEPKDARHGLLHDAAEAYLQDLIRPVKYAAGMEDYRKHLGRLETLVYARFGLEAGDPPSVSHADEVLLATEKRDLLPPCDWTGIRLPEPLPMAIQPVGPRAARKMFLARFAQLFPARLL